MTNQKPPLEFYVLDSLYENERRAYKSKLTGHDSIHVIEHTAYAALKAEAEKLVEVIEEYIGVHLRCYGTLENGTSPHADVARLQQQALTAWREKYGDMK